MLANNAATTFCELVTNITTRLPTVKTAVDRRMARLFEDVPELEAVGPVMSAM